MSEQKTKIQQGKASRINTQVVSKGCTIQISILWGEGGGERELSENVFVDTCTTVRGAEETATADVFDVQSYEQHSTQCW